MDDAFETGSAPEPVGSYPHARRVGDLLLLSGLGPRIPESGQVPGNQYDEAGRLVSWDIEAQTRQLVGNLEQVLNSSGASLEHLVDITVFMTDMKRDFATFNRVYTEYFSRIKPCRTTVEVGALPTPIAIEFKCIAWMGSGTRQRR